MRPPFGGSQNSVATMVGVTLNEPYYIYVVANAIKRLGSDIPYVLMPFFLKWVVGEDEMP